MFLVKPVRRCLNGSNFPLLIGVIIGLFLHANVTYFGDCFGSERNLEGDVKPKFERADVFQKPLAPRLVKPEELRNGSGTRKPTSKVVRPRYYSTELGIREKLFVGVLTSEEKISLQAVHINQTLTHLVDKVKFFITAQRKFKTNFNLSGVVGFTDTRYRYRPFQVIKYIGDTFIQDYDYYFLMNDFNYLQAERLKDLVKKLSVKNDVYLGNIVKDGSYCDLNAGILLSNSVLKAMKEHLDWCVINAITDDHSENIGRCIHHSIGLSCQGIIQGQTIKTYKLRHFSLQTHLNDLIKNDVFKNAIVVYPITEALDFYLLHAYYSKQKLLEHEKKVNLLSKNLTQDWPSGIRPGAMPASRFDVPNTYYFNMTHLFFPDDFTNVRKHTSNDLRDIQHIIDKIIQQVTNKELTYIRLINGYRTFDMSRGIDYQFDLEFRNSLTGKEIVKRFEVCKPLSNVEFIPVPYVTENSRIAILLPIQESETVQASDFLEYYTTNIMDRKEKSFLMLVFLYQYGSESKGDADPFVNLKSFAIRMSEQYHNEDTKIAWVSIRLPKEEEPVTIEKYPSLNFAIVDLALRKIGLETITLVASVHAQFSMDFINRVKMNTIENFQIFSVIPFRQYNPQITQIDQFDVNKNTGHFDKEEYSHLSFYGKDYVNVRKAAKNLVPIIRSDIDIEELIKHPRNNDGNLFKMFYEFSNEIHCMRATDMSFKLKYSTIHSHDTIRSLFLGTKAQIAEYITNKDAKFRLD